MRLFLWQWLFIGVICLAFVLRFYHLGSNPPGINWDEASLGWNAYSLWKTGSDEYGKSFPVSLRSFNDFKPAGYAYIAAPFIGFLGLNEFAVRLPSAIVGLLTVFLTFLLVRHLSENIWLSLLSAWLLAVSPWHIQFSRGAFEANLALFFFVLGGYFLWKWPFLAIFAFILSIYSYHSPRAVIPLFLLMLVAFYGRESLKRWRQILPFSIIFVVLLYPLIRNTIHTGSFFARYQTVAVKPEPVVLLRNYLSHFDLNFLFITGDSQERHRAPGLGLLYLAELPFLFAGFYFLFKDKPFWLPFLAAWFLAAPSASALAKDTPHAIRSLLFLPVWQIVIAYGIKNVIATKPVVIKLVVAIAFLANVFYFAHQYFIHLPKEFAPAWQYGYKQMVQKVLALEGDYDRVYITSAYDQPYIYFLFYGRVDPIIKNNGYFYSGFDKYEFQIPREKKPGNYLYVFSPKDRLVGDRLEIIDVINFPDGQAAFKIGRIKDI